MGEDICGRELLLKALCCFIRVRRKCSDIHKRGYPRVCARGSDHRAAIRMPNQDHGTADTLQAPSHVGDVLSVRIETVLSCNHLMSLGQKGRNQFAEARAVGPQAVDENDAGFALICQKFAPSLTGKNVSFAVRPNLSLKMLYGVVSLHSEYTAAHRNVRFVPQLDREPSSDERLRWPVWGDLKASTPPP